MNRLAPRGVMQEGVPGVVPRPVVALDLDGTLAQWHDDFLEFAWRWLHGRDRLPPPHWYRYVGGPLNDHMGVSKETYRAVKLAYRQSGMKRDLRLFPGAHDLVHTVRAAGAEVWVCTTRPYLRLDNIDPDTRELLDRNDLEVDGVIFGERKYRDLRQLVGRDRVVGVLDDLPGMVWQAEGEGFEARLIQRHHNQKWWNGSDKLREVAMTSLPSLTAAQQWLVAGIKDWRIKYDA